MNMTMLKFSQEVAKAIGNVDPSIVYEIIKISNDRRYIFHGIKRNNSFGSINEEGVKPLTPEGGWEVTGHQEELYLVAVLID